MRSGHKQPDASAGLMPSTACEPSERLPRRYVWTLAGLKGYVAWNQFLTNRPGERGAQHCPRSSHDDVELEVLTASG